MGVDGDALHGSAPIVPALPAAGVGGPAVARATVRSGVGEVVVTDRGRGDALAVLATTRTFDEPRR